MDWTATDFFRPFVNAWIGKLETAYRSEARTHWREVANECKIFYARSCASLWNSRYAAKFLNSVIERPRFPISINKAFELVAVVGPNILWQVPYRKVAPKRRLGVSEQTLQMLMQDPQMAQLLPQLLQADEVDLADARTVSSLLETWLNYTAREMPDGGMTEHAQLMAVDAMLTGRGVRFLRTHHYPNGRYKITGSFRENPMDVIFDPDALRIQDAKWVAFRHRDRYWEVERRFPQAGPLKDKGTLESLSHFGESAFGTEESTVQPTARSDVDGNKDVMVWYEIWSKEGPGVRSIPQIEDGLRQKMTQVLGDYCYICVVPNVPYPLNCSQDQLRAGMTDDQVRRAFDWPVPYWADNKWPMEVCDIYVNTDSQYPVPPLEPGMGWLKFMNLMMPWVCEEIWSGSRTFWAVLGSQVEEYEKYINSGKSQCIIPVNPSTDDIRKVIQILSQPPVNIDVWKILETAAEYFERATGLSAFMYGMKGAESNDRSAEETAARAKAAGVRPQFMQRRIGETESRLAASEALLARWEITGDDVLGLGGQVMRYLWDAKVSTGDVAQVVRELAYTIDTSSMQRPDRESERVLVSQAMQILGPNYMQYAMASGDFKGWNHLMKLWGETNLLDEEKLEGLYIQPPEPDPAAQQAQQQQMELEQAKIQAELQGKQMDVQAKVVDVQAKQQMAEIDAQAKVADVLVEQQKMRMELEHDQRKAQMDLVQQGGALQMAARKQTLDEVAQQTSLATKLQGEQVMGTIKIDLAKQTAEQKAKEAKKRAMQKPKAQGKK